MRSPRLRFLLIAGTLTLVAGCASSEEWNAWKSHPAHFASGSHMGFSVRNREGAPARVTRQDVAVARNESWWGKAITVSQEQILER
ncbi:MAG: hypothetical protein ACREM3_19830 [Candidatus Rokuibacteriota bacterium]